MTWREDEHRTYMPISIARAYAAYAPRPVKQYNAEEMTFLFSSYSSNDAWPID